MKIIRTLLIRRIAKLRRAYLRADTLSGSGVIRGRTQEFTSITVAAGGINHENCKSALTPAPFTRCACTALGVRAPHKTVRHISVRDLCDLRCRASCARSLSTDQSGCRCRCCCCSMETDGAPTLPATFAAPRLFRACRCSGNTETDMAPACIWICMRMRSRINVIRTKRWDKG